MGKKLFLAVLCVGLMGMGSIAQASTITVDTTVDSFDVPGECSLRSAVYAADKNVATGGCIAGTANPPTQIEADSLRMPGGTYELNISGTGEDEGKTGDLDISSGDWIELKPVERSQKVIIDGAGADRIFDIDNGRNPVRIQDVTLTGGRAFGAGPADGGGAVRVVSGGIQLVRALVTGNTSDTNGGGVLVYQDDGIISDNSTISGNSAKGSGGGLHIAPGSEDLASLLRLTTVTNNRADFDSDGIGDGGGVSIEGTGGTYIVLAYSILADNIDGSLPPSVKAPDCFAQTEAGLDSRYSIVTQQTGNSICKSKYPQTPVNPQLMPLADNGGPTRTHALAPTSPAIGFDPPSNFGGPRFAGCQLVDQRGAWRRIDSCDVGAYQFDTGLPGISKLTRTKAYLQEGFGATIRQICPVRFKPKCEITTVVVTRKKNGKPMSERRKVVLRSGESVPYGLELPIKPAFRKRVDRKTYTPGDKLIVRQKIKSKRVNGRRAVKPVTIYRSFDLRVYDFHAFN